jgi:hypothetical protein
MASWMPWSTDGMYSRGMRPPVTLVDELVAAAGFLGLQRDHDLGVLARTTGLLLVRVVDLLDGAAQGLAVGDLRLADVGLDLELARMRSMSTSRCSSPMPAMMVWPVSSSVWTRKVGSSSASRWIALPSFSWSDFVFGSMACG